MSRILVVDDEPRRRASLVDLLALHEQCGRMGRLGRARARAAGAGRLRPGDAGPAPAGHRRIETCARIRRRFGASLPVLMLTGLPDPGSLRQAYEAGADDFLQKPVDHTALILKVRAFLRLKSLHDETERHRERAQARARDLALLHEIGATGR
jgi:DNA-binding response OmpR family regulator